MPWIFTLGERGGQKRKNLEIFATDSQQLYVPYYSDQVRHLLSFLFLCCYFSPSLRLRIMTDVVTDGYTGSRRGAWSHSDMDEPGHPIPVNLSRYVKISKQIYETVSKNERINTRNLKPSCTTRSIKRNYCGTPIMCMIAVILLTLFEVFQRAE